MIRIRSASFPIAAARIACLLGLAAGSLSAQTAPPENQKQLRVQKSEESYILLSEPAHASPAPSATAKIDAIARIKDEGLKRSQVMKTLSYLTDVIGPRLTGSSNLKRANQWTRDKMVEWGLSNAHLEAWGPFGRGWTLKRFSAQVVDPQCIPLIAYPRAWSPGVKLENAPVVYFDVKTEADFAKYHGKLSGAVVLTGPPRALKAHFDPEGKRKTDSELLTLADDQEREGRNNINRRNIRNNPRFLARQLQAKKVAFLAAESPALLIDPSSNGDGGTLFVDSATVPAPPSTAPGARPRPWQKNAPAIIPQIVTASEHYNRLVRMIEQGESLKISVDLDVSYDDSDAMAYNTIAEIPGTDLKDEIVMLGGHMDSWHSGTGATDNGAGISVAMEAARIIKASGLKPRRKIRVALWSGEEQGLFGSRAYVKEHFGSVREKKLINFVRLMSGDKPLPSLEIKPEHEKLSVYFNLDNGTGKIRGVYLQGNEAARPIFREWLKPFADMGASTLTISNTGGTDHLSFDAIGLPGFQFIQDEIEYNARTHHSNQDVFDRIQEDDLKQASVIMATFVYNAASMNDKFPRKPLPKEDAMSVFDLF